MQAIVSNFRNNPTLVVFAVLGTVFLSVAGYFAFTTQKFMAAAHTSEGVVSELRYYPDRTSSPLIRYRLPDGRQAELIPDVRSSPPAYSEGERVRILYLPENPQQTARVDSIIELWFLPGVFGVLGLVFAGIPAGSWIIARRQGSQPASDDRSGEEFLGIAAETIRESKANPDTSAKWLLIFPAIGVLLLLFAGYFGWRQFRFITTAPQYTAVVVALERSGKTYYPVFEFRDAGGKTRRAYGSVGSSPPAFKVGETAEILYDSSDNSATQRGFFSEWFVALILGFIGTVFFAVGSGVMFVFRKRP